MKDENMSTEGVEVIDEPSVEAASSASEDTVTQATNVDSLPEQADAASAEGRQNGADAPKGEPDEVARLRARVSELEAALAREQDQATEYMKSWQRAAADLANLRRRTQQEREELVKIGDAVLITELLAVLDNFERALSTLPSALRQLTWVDGVYLIHRHIQMLLDRHGLAEVGHDTSDFDPAVHEAVLSETTTVESEDGVVVSVLQRGYKLGDRTLRPALVKVKKFEAATA